MVSSQAEQAGRGDVGEWGGRGTEQASQKGSCRRVEEVRTEGSRRTRV